MSAMNAFYAQSGGVTAVINASACGVIETARQHPDKRVVFLGVGFETTAPTVAGTIKIAQAQGVENFTVLSFHKLVPPALNGLLAGGDVDGDVLQHDVVVGVAVAAEDTLVVPTVFDADKRLAHFNQAYVDLWQLDPEWLATRPRHGEILDRLLEELARMAFVTRTLDPAAQRLPDRLVRKHFERKHGKDAYYGQK
mgnify:CR=1 FL=1